MIPGRELDALVAEKVMGWKYTRHREPDLDPTPSVFLSVPKYSTDIAAAWEVVEKLREKFSEVAVYGASAKEDYPEPFVCEISDLLDIPRDTHIKFEGRGSTAPLAICLAALDSQVGRE